MPAATPRTDEVRERMSVIVWRMLARLEHQGDAGLGALKLWTTFSPTTGLIRRSRSSDIGGDVVGVAN